MFIFIFENKNKKRVLVVLALFVSFLSYSSLNIVKSLKNGNSNQIFPLLTRELMVEILRRCPKNRFINFCLVSKQSNKTMHDLFLNELFSSYTKKQIKGFISAKLDEKNMYEDDSALEGDFTPQKTELFNRNGDQNNTVFNATTLNDTQPYDSFYDKTTIMDKTKTLDITEPYNSGEDTTILDEDKTIVDNVLNVTEPNKTESVSDDEDLHVGKISFSPRKSKNIDDRMQKYKTLIEKYSSLHDDIRAILECVDFHSKESEECFKGIGMQMGDYEDGIPVRFYNILGEGIASGLIGNKCDAERFISFMYPKSAENIKCTLNTVIIEDQEYIIVGTVSYPHEKEENKRGFIFTSARQDESWEKLTKHIMWPSVKKFSLILPNGKDCETIIRKISEKKLKDRISSLFLVPTDTHYLPKNIDRLENLRDLHASNLKLETMPGLQKLSQLKKLIISNNNLKKIDSKTLPRGLRVLDIEENNVSCEELLNLQNERPDLEIISSTPSSSFDILLNGEQKVSIGEINFE